MITEADVKVDKLHEEVEALKHMQKLKEEATYVHLIRVIKTILVLWFLTIVAFVGGIVWYLSQFDYELVQEDAIINSQGGDANMITGDGSVINDG
jgi:hypothetical protein